MGRVRPLRVAIFGFALLLIGTAGVGVYSAFPREPRYEDRSLSQWLEPGSRSNPYCYAYPVISGQGRDPNRREVRDAIQAMGTNALPFLIKWNSAKDSERKAEIFAWLNDHLPPRFHLWSPHQRQNAAYIGFAFLQDKAKPALPLFIAMTLDPDPYRRMSGLDCVVYCQPDEATLISVIQGIIEGNDHELLDHLAFRMEDGYHDKTVAARIYQRFPQLKPRTATQANSVTVKSD